MEANMKASFDSVPPPSDSKMCPYDSLTLTLLIFNLLRYANCSAHFTNAYVQGASGPIVVWANQKYHGHWILPSEILTKLKNEFYKKYGHD
jgi:hypothetical protein